MKSYFSELVLPLFVVDISWLTQPPPPPHHKVNSVLAAMFYEDMPLIFDSIKLLYPVWAVTLLTLAKNFEGPTELKL